MRLDLILAYAQIFMYITVGYIASYILKERKKKLIKAISWFLLYISLTIVILDSITLNFEKIIQVSFEIITISLSIIFVSLISAYSLSEIIKVRDDLKGVIMLCSANWNAIFIPFPIILIIAGLEGLSYASIIASVVLSFIPILTIIIEIMYSETRRTLKNMLKDTFTFPPLLAVITAIVMGISDIRARDLLPYESFFTINAQILSTLAMILIGMLLYGHKIKLSKEVIITSLTRFLISPILAFLLAIVFSLKDVAFIAVIVESLMPPAVMNPVIAAEIDLSPNKAAEIVFTTTFISLFISLPIILLL